jgi:Holliday junction resolvase
MTPESKVKKAINELLDEFRDAVWRFMPAQGMYAKKGVPDFVCCINGKFFCVETKAPGKNPTALQSLVHFEIDKAGGRVFVIDSAGCIQMTQLRAFLEKETSA